jgi:hypothetical protein
MANTIVSSFFLIGPPGAINPGRKEEKNMYIDVSNFRAKIMVDVEHGAVDITHLIPRADRMILTAIKKQGGSINRSGRYQVSDAILRNYQKHAEKIKAYIEEQAKILNLCWRIEIKRRCK